MLISSTSDNFNPYFSNIPDKRASSNPPTENPIFLFLRSFIDFIGPSFRTTRLFNGVLTKDPSLTIGRD